MDEFFSNEESPAVVIPAGEVFLHGNLVVPPSARGVVVFAHGSGSGRFSPRNQFVAAALRRGNLGTLLFDLLTREEEKAELASRHLRFDIPFLSRRLLAAIDWLTQRRTTRDLDLGLIGASTGTAAALVAAAERPPRVSAVVSRGGRPDLAEEALRRVRCATLLIVGGEDHSVLRLNEEALKRLRSEKKLEVIPGATHLFEEPGALEQVSALARQWFVGHTRPPAPGKPPDRRRPAGPGAIH